MSQQYPDDENYIHHLEFMNEQLRREQEQMEKRLGVLRSNEKVKTTSVLTWKQIVFRALVRLMRIGS